MSYLLADEFNDSTPLVTSFRLQNTGIKLGYLRAHCYKRGVVTGTFTCTIKQGTTTLGSTTITASDINGAGGTFMHGMFTWEFDSSIALHVLPELDEQEYSIEFTSSGYVGDASNNFNLCKDFDNRFIDDYGLHFSEATPEQKAASQPYGITLFKWDN